MSGIAWARGARACVGGHSSQQRLRDIGFRYLNVLHREFCTLARTHGSWHSVYTFPFIVIYSVFIYNVHVLDVRSAPPGGATTVGYESARFVMCSVFAGPHNARMFM